MPKFVADVVVRFESESLEHAGKELRRLQQLAAAGGFDVKRGRVIPAPADEGDDARGSGYGPIATND